jgi:peptide/nickel transport system substrate-binding protein
MIRVVFHTDASVAVDAYGGEEHIMSEQVTRIDGLLAGTVTRRGFVKLSGLAAAGLAMSGLLVACGDDDDDEPAAPAPAPDDDDEDEEPADEEEDEPVDEPDDEEDEADAPADGDHLDEMVVAVTPDPINMSPWLPNSMTGYSMHYHVHEPVIFRDDDMELMPVLAESWEQVEPTTLQLNLRQGIMFTNGEELTSEAVKFSYEKVLDEEHGALWRGMIASIVDIETPDDYTVLLNTGEPNRALLRNLTLVGIMTEGIFDEIGGDWATNAVGTGPYTFVEFRPAERLILERNDDYWGDAPLTRRLDIRVITETGTRVSALQTGEVLVVNNVPPDQVDRIESDPNLTIMSTPTARIVYLGFRVDREPFDDVRVRQAINYAVNQDEIVQGLFLGLTDAADGPLAPMVFGAKNDLGPWPYDPDMARQLLEEAGVAEGQRIVLGTPDGRYIQDRQVSEAVAGYLAEVGFDVDFRAAEFGEFQNEVLRGAESEYDLHLLAWGVINMEPDYQLRAHFHSEWTDTRTGYSNQEVDQLLDLAAASVDDDDLALQYLHDAQEIIWDECPWIWLYYQPEIHGVNTRVSGYTPRPDEYILFNRAQATS